jgi:hypothetical protein
MNEQDLKTIVDNAVALHREIAAKSEQLKALKAELVKEALRHPKALVGTESGGKRWTTKGSDGCLARVNFPAPALVSEIEGQGPLAKELHEIAGDKFRRLFSTVKVYQLAENFRAEAKANLPEAKAEALVKLCENQSAPRVSFEAASQPIAVAVAA